jgi:hypothetical protein
MRSLRVALLAAAALLATGLAFAPMTWGQVRVNIGIPLPYVYSPTYCDGCYHGEWQGREGYHRDGDRGWERGH